MHRVEDDDLEEVVFLPTEHKRFRGEEPNLAYNSQRIAGY